MHPEEHAILESMFLHESSSLNIGLTYDTRDDYRFSSDDPADWDAEYEVSTAIDDVAHALEDLGHTVDFIGSGQKLLERIKELQDSIDIVFNIAEGYGGRGREARIPAVLEISGIPYVGSDSYALSLALNKWHTKILALSANIRTPAFEIIRQFTDIDELKLNHVPLIVKPCYEGSSKGLTENSLAETKDELRVLVRKILREYKQPAIVEEFIEGKEIDVPIIGNSPNKVFGVVGITLDGKLDLGKNFLTSNIVRKDGYGFRYPLDNETYVGQAQLAALRIYNFLECQDFGRVDMRIDKEGNPYFLEINPYPFLGFHSSFNEVAQKTGLGYKNMIGLILQSALERLSRAPVSGSRIQSKM